jgi:hypothetical protein
MQYIFIAQRKDVLTGAAVEVLWSEAAGRIDVKTS